MIRSRRCQGCLRSRSGFSLVELLVVIAIIAVLAALLVPAVQRAREASRRVACINNLKQLTLACMNYETTHRCLPSGYVVGTDGISTVSISPALNVPVWPESSAARPGFNQWYLSDNWSWHALILPQLGDPGTGVDTRNSKGTVSNLAGMSVSRATFRCPGMTDTSEVFADLGGGSRVLLQFCNYRGNAGTNLRLSNSASGIVDDGVMFRDSSIRMADIRDGESNTLLLVESAVGVWGDGLSAATRAADDNSDGLPDWGADGISPSAVPSAFDSFLHSPGVLLAFSPGSWHGEVLHCSLADGSTRSLAKTISFEVLQAMSSRSGQERVNLP